VIVVDTSVWIDAARRPGGACARTLGRLLDADEVALALPVRLELMAGVARKDRRALRRGLSGLPVVSPSEETWRSVEGWVDRAAEAGQRFAMTDLLIAGLAADIDALVWSLDDDFARMEGLGLVRRYA
jgi:predicted nucleic acid-binding protein